MKKKLLLPTLMLVFFTMNLVQSQETSNNSIGVRLTNFDNVNVELSWQHKLKENKRLEIDLGYKDGISNVAGLYQWVWSLKNNFNWYVGAGALLNTDLKSENVVSAAGNIGVEYVFEGPFQLALDLRPSIQVVGSFAEINRTPLALSIRYCF